MICFGTFVRQLRVKKALGLRETARQLDISPTYLSQIEHGRVPGPAILRRMADLYKVPLEEFLQRATERIPDVVADEVRKDPVIAALHREVMSIDEEEQIKVLSKLLEQRGLSQDDIKSTIEEILKQRPPPGSFKRLSRGREGLFAADVRPPILSRKGITAIADNVLRHAGFSGPEYRLPIPIEQIIESDDSTRIVWHEGLDDNNKGPAAVLGASHWAPNRPGAKIIKINPKLADDDTALADQRIRFTLGHEYFHVLEHLPLMHELTRRHGACLRGTCSIPGRPRAAAVLENAPSGPQWWLRTRDRPRRLTSHEDWREWQANTFASCFLMPEAAVRRAFHARFRDGGAMAAALPESKDTRAQAYEAASTPLSTDGVFEPLHAEFAVSRQAMAIRLRQLGLA